MGKRYYGYSYSTHSGTQYRADIIDTSFGGAATEITLMGDGITFEVQQQGDERHTPIKGMRVDVNLAITDDATGLALQSWINSTMLQTEEDKYQIAIYKDSDLVFFGNLLYDLGTKADASRPYEFKISATDGLARLKEINFTFSTATDGGTMNSITDYLWLLLKETPLYKQRSYIGQTILFGTSVDWYETQMDARAGNKDPLAMTQVNSYAFSEATGPVVVENRRADQFSYFYPERRHKTYYEVLEAICIDWNMRVIMWDGIFKFIQLSANEDDGYTKWLRYYEITTGAYDSYVTLPAAVDVNDPHPALPRVAAGNQWQYFAPLKTVSRRFPFTQTNMLNGRHEMDYSQDLPDYIGGSTVGLPDVALQFQTTVDISIQSATYLFTIAPNNYVSVIEITIRLGSGGGGSYWLSKSPFSNVATWNSFASIYGHLVVSGSQYAKHAISFITPPLPAGTFNDSLCEIADGGMALLTSGTPISNTLYSVKRETGSTGLYYTISGAEKPENEYMYKVGNTASVINSYDIELPDAWVGEMYQTGYFGGLFTGPFGGPFTPSTKQWGLHDTGTRYSFNEMLVREVMGGQILPLEKYQGAIIGSTIFPDSAIAYDGDIYILNGGTYSTKTETWDGEWFKIGYDRADIDTIDNETGEATDGGLPELRGLIGGRKDGIDENTYSKGDYFVRTDNANVTLEPVSQIFTATGAINVTMPAASDMNRENVRSAIITVKHAGLIGDAVTIIGTIDGVVDPVLAQYESMTIYSDGTQLLTKN